MYLSCSRKIARLTKCARGISCERRQLFIDGGICKSLYVSSRITAKLRDLRKLHESLENSKPAGIAKFIDCD